MVPLHARHSGGDCRSDWIAPWAQVGSAAVCWSRVFPLVSPLLASPLNHDGGRCLARCHAVAVLASGQRPAASGQWPAASGHRPVVSGQLSVVSGQLSVVSGQRPAAFFMLEAGGARAIVAVPAALYCRPHIVVCLVFQKQKNKYIYIYICIKQII